MVLGFILFMRKSRLQAEVMVILVKGLKLVYVSDSSLKAKHPC